MPFATPGDREKWIAVNHRPATAAASDAIREMARPRSLARFSPNAFVRPSAANRLIVQFPQRPELQRFCSPLV
jgi:hypothetical protein